MSKFLKSLHSTSLFFRVASILLFSITLVSISITMINIKMSKDVLVNTFTTSSYKVLTQITESFTPLNDKILNIINTISVSSDFEKYFTDDNTNPIFTYKTIYNMKNHLSKTIPENDFNDITVLIVGVNGKTHVINGDRITSNLSEILKNPITENALNHKDMVLYQYLDHGFTSSTKENSAIVATKILCNKITKEPYGFLYVLINQNIFQKYYSHFVGNGNDIAILSADGTIISSNLESQIGQKNPNLYNISNYIQNNKLTYINTQFNSNDVAILSKHLPIYNFNVVGIINKDRFLNEMYNTSDIILVSTMIALIFIFINFLIIQRTTQPISVLAKKMPQIIFGDFNNHISVTGSYEVRELSSAFNYMLDGLSSYINKQIKLEKEKRKAEIHALQMQINPHFIYNTLSSLKWLMWQGNVEKSIQTIDAFISLLQNTISNKKEMITICEEITNLKNYVLINHIRYGDNINVNFFVMPQCNEYVIPKLILQPFIENAFFHAFSGKNNGHIHVFINEIDENVVCEIIDNGVGISNEDIRNILSKSINKHNHFTSIGIHNVNDRIKLLYGDEYGITITSELNKGTTVKLVLPAQKIFLEK